MNKITELIDNSKVLDKVNRIFGFHKVHFNEKYVCDNHIIIEEHCDYYYAEELTKEDMKELGNLFLEIAECMESEK